MTITSTLPRVRRSSGFLLAGGALAAVSAGATLLLGGLQTNYEKARVFEVSYSTESSTETLKMEVMRNGEPMDRGGRGGGERTQTFELAYTDTVLEAADGSPSKTQRVFDSIGGDSSSEGRDGPVERSLESAFDGLTLVLSESAGEVKIEVTDGDAPDEDRLQGHSLRLPLDGLMPKESVEVGAEWEIEGLAFLAAIGTDLQTKLTDPAERGGGGERGGRGGGGGGQRGQRGGQRGGGGNGMLAQGDWTITATLTDETRDVDGVSCAVIKIEADVEGEPEAGGGGRGGMQTDRSFEGTFEGELLFCTEKSYPVSLDVSGSYQLSADMSSDSDRGSFEMSSIVETTITANVTVGASTASSDD
ncbi:MAG: hypothetical protein ACJAZN_003459 [Planctomycetota bacterium]|jgi:hypothetical protein